MFAKRFQCIYSMSGYESHVPPTAFEVPNCLNATWIHCMWETRCPLQMAAVGQKKQIIFLRVPIYCLLEFLINFICSFHIIVIVIIELNLTSCAQCKILTCWNSRNEMKMGYTKAKKKQSFFQKLARWNFFFSLTSPHIYIFNSKKKQQTNNETKTRIKISKKN